MTMLNILLCFRLASHLGFVISWSSSAIPDKEILSTREYGIWFRRWMCGAHVPPVYLTHKWQWHFLGMNMFRLPFLVFWCCFCCWTVLIWLWLCSRCANFFWAWLVTGCWAIHVRSFNVFLFWFPYVVNNRWLQDDLQNVNRTQTPWVILTSHRMMVSLHIHIIIHWFDYWLLIEIDCIVVYNPTARKRRLHCVCAHACCPGRFALR